MDVMDVFIEQLIVKVLTPKERMLQILSLVGLGFVGILLIMISGVLGPFGFITLLGAAGCLYGAWYLFSSFNTEFEYALTNGEIDIDKIIAKRKRARLITVKAKEIEIMAPVSDKYAKEINNPSFKKKIDAASSENSKDAYFITLNSEKYGLTRVIFEPNQQIIDGMKAAAPRKVFTE